jgi:hypothetical protein
MPEQLDEFYSCLLFEDLSIIGRYMVNLDMLAQGLQI